MTKLFLHAKHWQLFLLQFGIPILLEIIFINILLGPASNNTGAFASISVIFFVMMLFFAGTLFLWIWSVSIGLQKMMPDHFRTKVYKFKIFFFIPIFYISSILSFMGNDTSNALAIALLVIIPLHLFSMFCIFYCIYFTAKTLKIAELQRHVTFSDLAGEFFLIWFYPIGIWILQPRINALVKTFDTKTAETGD